MTPIIEVSSGCHDRVPLCSKMNIAKRFPHPFSCAGDNVSYIWQQTHDTATVFIKNTASF